MAVGYVCEAVEMPKTSCFACWHAHSNENELRHQTESSQDHLGCSQFFHWWFDKIHSFFPYWHQFVFGEFAFCIETTLSHCEWFFAQSFLKCGVDMSCRWLFKMLPYCLNISTCSDSNIPSTVTFIVISYTSSVPKFLDNLCYRLPAWSLSPRKFPAKFSGLRPLILLKNNFPKFLTFRALKIGLQHPSWCQTTSTGLVCSIPENKESVIIFFENISKEK